MKTLKVTELMKNDVLDNKDVGMMVKVGIVGEIKEADMEVMEEILDTDKFNKLEELMSQSVTETEDTNSTDEEEDDKETLPIDVVDIEWLDRKTLVKFIKEDIEVITEDNIDKFTEIAGEVATKRLQAPANMIFDGEELVGMKGKLGTKVGNMTYNSFEIKEAGENKYGYEVKGDLYGTRSNGKDQQVSFTIFENTGQIYFPKMSKTLPPSIHNKVTKLILNIENKLLETKMDFQA